MAPLYLAHARLVQPQDTVAASVLTIHNLAFQGVFPMDVADPLGELTAALGLPSGQLLRMPAISLR